MNHNSTSLALTNHQEAILYFGTGRGPIGSAAGMLYLMKDAMILPVGGLRLLASPKRELLEIVYEQR